MTVVEKKNTRKVNAARMAQRQFFIKPAPDVEDASGDQSNFVALVKRATVIFQKFAVDCSAFYKIHSRVAVKRSLFLALLGVAAFLEGFYLGPIGFELCAWAIIITIVLAIGWMRTYWDAA